MGLMARFSATCCLQYALSGCNTIERSFETNWAALWRYTSYAKRDVA
jgi:hypothetical protein